MSDNIIHLTPTQTDRAAAEAEFKAKLLEVHTTAGEHIRNSGALAHLSITIQADGKIGLGLCLPDQLKITMLGILENVKFQIMAGTVL